MKYSIVAHRNTRPVTNSQELMREDVECFTQEELRRKLSAIEQKGWNVNVILKDGQQMAGRDRKSRPA